MNDELVKVLGADFDWASFIKTAAMKRASGYHQAILDDIVADVTADIILAVKDGKLAVAISKARDASKDETELLKNLKGVVWQAAKYRVGDAVKWKYRKRAIQFSNIEGEFSIQARSDNSNEVDEYKPLLVNELNFMASTAARHGKDKLAKRLRLAAQVVPDRIDGLVLGQLMERHGVVSSSRMQAILDDIGQALAHVAGRLNDPTLLHGTSHVLVG